MAEAQFRLRGITADLDDKCQYCLLLAVLPREAFRMVAHLVERGDDAEDEEDRYDQLKAALVSSHVMSRLQASGIAVRCGAARRQAPFRAARRHAGDLQNISKISCRIFGIRSYRISGWIWR
jgi:hypothetical protein